MFLLLVKSNPGRQATPNWLKLTKKTKLIVKDRQAFICQLRPGPNFAREILKHSFISSIRPTFYTNPSRKRKFLKTHFKPEEEFKTAGFSFSCGREKEKKKAFRRPITSDNHVISLTEKKMIKHKSKVKFKFLWRSVDGKHLTCSQSETYFLKFFWRSADEA